MSNLKDIKPNQFDMVFIEFVLLEIPKKTKLNKLFKEAYRVLKKGETIFISDMHPFDPIVHDRFKLPKDFNYFKSGSEMVAYAKQLDGSTISFTDYHWTLEDYFGSIKKAGFVVTDLKEPRPTDKMVEKIPYLNYRKNLPKDIIIKAKK